MAIKEGGFAGLISISQEQEQTLNGRRQQSINLWRGISHG